MTPGPKFSSSTSAVLSRARKTSPARVLEVEGQAPLVGVEGEVEEAVGVGPVPHGRAGDVALARLLDLDHVGAQPGQHLPARRPRLVVGDVDDPDTGERLAHGMVSIMATVSTIADSPGLESPPCDAGVFHQASEADGRTHADRYAEMFDLIAFGDTLGFDVAWLAELHFGGAFSLLASPLMTVPVIARGRGGSASAPPSRSCRSTTRSAARSRRRPPTCCRAGGSSSASGGARSRASSTASGSRWRRTARASTRRWRSSDSRGRRSASAIGARSTTSRTSRWCRGRSSGRTRRSGSPCTRRRASPTSATWGWPSIRGRRPRPCRSSASTRRSTARGWRRRATAGSTTRWR